MSTDDHKVDSVFVTLMVSRNIMESNVFLLLANLSSVKGTVIWQWVITIITGLELPIVYTKMSLLDDNPGGSYAYIRRVFGSFIWYQKNWLYWLTDWIRNIVMVVIGISYGLFSSVFLKPNKVSMSVVRLIIIVILMTIVQITSISPNAAKEFTLVSLVAAIFTLIYYLYTCSALLLIDHGYMDNKLAIYITITLIAFFYCICVVIDSDAKKATWPFFVIMIITVLYVINYNHHHINVFPPNKQISKIN